MSDLTESSELQAVLRRLSALASDGLTEHCAVVRSDLAALLTAYNKNTKIPDIFDSIMTKTTVYAPPERAKGIFDGLESDEDANIAFEMTMTIIDYDLFNPIVDEEELALQK